MPKVDREFNKDGDFLVDYEEKVFEDVQAEDGQKALVTFHTIAMGYLVDSSSHYILGVGVPALGASTIVL